MANVYELTEEQQAEWSAWLDTRPPLIRDMAERYPPWKLFRLTSTGQRVTTYSYSEDGTMTVMVGGEFNHVMFPRQVFGIHPDELVECDLPAADDLTGAVSEQLAEQLGVTPEAIEDAIFAAIRAEWPQQQGE